MAQLIQIRQRIKAIETIKKITHAMRLISMSSHTRLSNKKNAIEQYKTTTTDLLQNAYKAHPSWNSFILQPTKKINPRNLIILIGSQKGLCGNFNTMLFSFFEERMLHQLDKSFQGITVGKKAETFLAAKKGLSIMNHYVNLNSTTISTITSQLVNIIITAHPHFSSITIFSNVLKTFFAQQPQVTQLIPFITDPTNDKKTFSYHWEQSPEIIFKYLTHEYLYARLYYLLYESLLAEQATRFIAMDNSTRNAEQLLDNMNLMYNKLRQTKITRELTELMTSF